MPLLLSIISFVATTTGMYYYKNKLAVRDELKEKVVILVLTQDDKKGS